MKKLKIKRKLTTLLLMLFSMTLLTGCGIEISIQNFNKYVDIGAPGGEATLSEKFGSELDAVTGQLEEVLDMYDGLGITITASDTDTETSLNDYVNAMNDWHSKIGSAKIVSGGSTTTIGGILMDSLVINKTESNQMLTYVTGGLAKSIVKSLASNKTVSVSKINFDGSSGNAKSDINRALTIMGLNVDTAEIAMKYASTHADVPAYNCGTDLADCFIKYADNNPSVTFTECSAKEGGNWSLKPTVEAIDDNTMLSFSFSTANLTKFMNLSGDQVPLFVGYGTTDTDNGTSSDNAEVNVALSIISNSSRANDLDACMNGDGGMIFSHDGGHVVSKSGGTFKAWQEKLYSRHSERYDEYRGQMLHAFSAYEWLDPSEITDTFLQEAVYTYVNPSTGDTEAVWVPVGAIKQIEAGTDGKAGSEYWAYIYVKLSFKQFTIDGEASVDIRELCDGNTVETKTDFPILPADSTLLSSAYQGRNYSAADFLKTLSTKANGKVLVLKDNPPNSELLKTATTIKLPDDGTGKLINPNKQTYFEILKDSSGNDVYLNLLSNFKDDYMKLLGTSEIPIYIGDKKLGTIYVENFTSDLTQSNTIATLQSDGTTKREGLMQKYSLYYDNSGQIYILYGLTDIMCIERFVAHEATDKGDGSHTYEPYLDTTSMVYNIFDKNIYAANSTTSYKFDSTSGVQFYTADNLLISDITTDYVNATTGIEYTTHSTYSRNVIPTGTDFKAFRNAVYNRTPILVLNSYLEAVFLPNTYEDEPFVCLGRKVVFNSNILKASTPITENSVVFNILLPDTASIYVEGTADHTMAELINSKLVTKDGISGLGFLHYLGYKDVIRNYLTYDSIATISSFRTDSIKAGEFKTKAGRVFGTSYGLFATSEAGLSSKASGGVLPLFTWSTATDVDTNLVQYLKSTSFTAWLTWLKNNGYSNYLNADDLEPEDLAQNLVVQFESVYDLSFSNKTSGTEIMIDTEGIDELQDWLDRTVGEEESAILDVVIRTIAIILIVYSFAILACYVIDVAVAGEGDGLLKKITFNRMQTVTGLSKEERKQMSQRNEKDTYTTRAVAIQELVPLVLVLWAVATVIIVGQAYNIVDKMIEMATNITRVIKDAIG